MPNEQVSSPLEDAHRQFTSELIAGVSSEVAQNAARAMLKLHPQLADRYRPLPDSKWRANFVARLGELSISVATGRPNIFADQVVWTMVAYRARRVPIEDVRIGLRFLREALRAAVTDEDWQLIDPHWEAAFDRLDAGDDAPASLIGVDTPHGRLAAEYLLAVLEGDRRRAAAVVLNRVEAGDLEVTDAYQHVLLPVQRELGRLWHLNEATVGEEHFATATTQLVISQLHRFIKPKPFNGLVFVAGTVDGNTHDIGLRMVSDYFEMDGWRAVYLGASVPADDIAVAAEHFDADLVGLSATMHTHLRRLEDAITSLRRTQSGRTFRVLVGGAAFSGMGDLWRDIGADGFAPDLSSAVEIGNRLIKA